MLTKTKYQKLHQRAKKEMMNKEFIKAKNTYLECLAIKPNDIGLLNNLAQLSSMIGEEDKSKTYNEILLKECNHQLKHEKTERLLITKSNALISLDRNDEAIKTIDELLKIAPDNIIGLFHKSQYLELNQEYEKALHYINQILNNDQLNIAALLSKGRILTQLNEFKRAENCYNLVFKMETMNKAAINLKSNLIKHKYGHTLTAHDFMIKAVNSFEKDNFKASEDYFKKALEIDDKYDEIWFAQGELFIRTGQISKAIKSFDKAFELNPTSGGIVEKKGIF